MTKLYVFIQDNPPGHSALSIKRFLATYSIPVLDHLLFLLYFTPCDFYLFLKVKSALKGIRFESVEAGKEKATHILKKLPEISKNGRFTQYIVGIEERCILKTIISKQVWNENKIQKQTTTTNIQGSFLTCVFECVLSILSILKINNDTSGFLETVRTTTAAPKEEIPQI